VEEGFLRTAALLTPLRRGPRPPPQRGQGAS
jgi:hypothetical protein